MKHHIVDTIRKLLRLAKDGTKEEAAIASVRAQELMSRHKIHVALEDSDHFRQEVDKVVGVFWREQLLLSVAKFHSCRALRQPKGGRQVAVLSGDRKNVNEAYQDYYFYSTTILFRCIAVWNKFLESNKGPKTLPDTFDNYDSSYGGYSDSLGADGFISRIRAYAWQLPAPPTKPVDPRVCAPVWFMTFLDAAVNAIDERLNPKTKIKPATVPKAAQQGFVKSDFDYELERLEREAKTLAQQTSESATQQVREKGAKAGSKFGKSVDVQWRTNKLLTADSSFLSPPPEPSRFNQLEFDTLKTPEVPLERRVLEID